MELETNFVVRKRSRKKPVEGDLFTCTLSDGMHLWGRVVKTPVVAAWFEGCILVYIYSYRSDDSTLIPVEARQVPSGLLIPPVMIDVGPWRAGVFETVANAPLEEGEVLHAHCFRDIDPSGRFFDEMSNEIEPQSGDEIEVGVFALRSHYTIDYDISRALGLPVVEDELMRDE